jgi:hypothetical protein
MYFINVFMPAKYAKAMQASHPSRMGSNALSEYR